MLPAIAAAIHHINPGIVIWHTLTMTERIGESPAAYLHRLLASLVAAFAAMALLLAVVGLQGVIAYSVG